MNEIVMQILAKQPASYSIKIGSGFLLNPAEWLSLDYQGKQLVIITDDNVNKIYGEKLANALANYKPLLLSFLPGEKSKNYLTKQSLEDQMFEHHCNRDTIILSLGGGVVGDIAGFVASTYMRGISYIQIPTTLLAMIDSSVGGKTAINTNQGKNLIGAFWQPSYVVADLNCLMTLPKVQVINGLIEAIKIFMTNDAYYFNYVNNNIENIINKDILVIKNIVEQAIKLKVSVVSQDERENKHRVVLNFGHTIGHAIEKMTDYTILHGYAVALGILVEAKISQLLGFLSLEYYQIIQSLFFRLNITLSELKKLNCDEIILATKSDKKMKLNSVRYVLLNEIGNIHYDDNIYVHPVSDEIVKKAICEVQHDG